MQGTGDPSVQVDGPTYFTAVKTCVPWVKSWESSSEINAVISTLMTAKELNYFWELDIFWRRETPSAIYLYWRLTLAVVALTVGALQQESADVALPQLPECVQLEGVAVIYGLLWVDEVSVNIE